MNIVFCVDKNMYNKMLVSLVSLLENNSGTDLSI